LVLAGKLALHRSVPLATLVLIGLALPWAAWAAAPTRDMLARGSQWLTVKGGYAKSAVDDAPDANVGFGVTYSYFFRPQMSVAAALQYDVLGRYQGPAEVEMPLTVEGTYHFRWPTQAIPYMGLGSGAAFHSYLYTGDDSKDTRWIGYVLGGIDLPVTARALLGLDLRMEFETGGKSENPWFPSEDNTVMHWSWKLAYTYAL
jgi:outer membrane protein W